ncbi:ribose 5-phosphate isomerase B [Hamadaea sp. NPDC051192]|uniref:ribose 5-phosphate isomerase B n=1 Tax=Hamadaea sp. NPDC051192 TaxID=3154940 RepID=UPI003436CFC9
MNTTAPSPYGNGRAIAVGSDHVGLDLRVTLMDELQAAGFEILDHGTATYDRVDYPDIAYPVARAVADGAVQFGLLICGTGAGMQIAANRHPAVRAVVISDFFTARHARAHNDANVACLGARTVTPVVASELVQTFLTTEFEQGRHQRRIDKLSEPPFP